MCHARVCVPAAFVAMSCAGAHGALRDRIVSALNRVPLNTQDARATAAMVDSVVVRTIGAIRRRVATQRDVLPDAFAQVRNPSVAIDKHPHNRFAAHVLHQCEKHYKTVSRHTQQNHARLLFTRNDVRTLTRRRCTVLLRCIARLCDEFAGVAAGDGSGSSQDDAHVIIRTFRGTASQPAVFMLLAMLTDLATRMCVDFVMREYGVHGKPTSSIDNTWLVRSLGLSADDAGIVMMLQPQMIAAMGSCACAVDSHTCDATDDEWIVRSARVCLID